MATLMRDVEGTWDSNKELNSAAITESNIKTENVRGTRIRS